MKRFFLIIFGLFFPTLIMAEEEFPFLISTSRTSLENASENVKHNIMLAGKKIDGLIIKETLSIKKQLGEISKNKAYKEEIVFVRGIGVKKTGGGICQLVSTIYNASLLAGLQIIERHAHSKKVGHIKAGLDAAIAEQGKDLKIKNPMPFPLKIKIEVSEKSLVVKILSPYKMKQKVKLKVSKIEIDPPTIAVKQAASNRQQKRSKVKRDGQKGELVIVKRIFIGVNGEEREEIISKDYYAPVASEIYVR